MLTRLAKFIMEAYGRGVNTVPSSQRSDDFHYLKRPKGPAQIHISLYAVAVEDVILVLSPPHALALMISFILK